MKYAIAICLALCLVSCSRQGLEGALVPKAESEFAQEYLEKLRNQDYEYVKSYMHPELQPHATQEQLEQLYNYFPKSTPRTTELIGSQVHVFNDVWSAVFTFESEYSDGWSLSSVSMTKDQEDILVTSINIYQTPDSQKVINAFKNAEITLFKVIVLVFTFVSPIIMIVTFIGVYRTEMVKKWRWYLLSFVGVCSFSLNWTTGVLSTKIATLQILGFGASTMNEYAPVVFTFTLPVGALIFWYKRSQLLKEATSENSGS